MVLVPAFSVTLIDVVIGVAKLVPVIGTWIPAPPLTLTKKVRVPFTRPAMVICLVPDVAAVTESVTWLVEPFPMKPTFWPPEQAEQLARRAAPLSVPDSASTVVLAGAGRGGRRRADRVATGIEVGRHGRRGPGVPATGAVEGDVGGDDRAVDGDVHRPVGGGAVGVADPQGLAAGRLGVHRPFDKAARDVVRVGEAGTGEADVVVVHRAGRDRGVLRLVPDDPAGRRSGGRWSGSPGLRRSGWSGRCRAAAATRPSPIAS